MTWHGDGIQQAHEVVAADISVINDPSFHDVDISGLESDPVLSVGPEGDIYVAARAGSWFFVYHSTDGGANFSIPDRELMVQVRLQMTPAPHTVEGLIELLDRAAGLHEPTRSYYRLRAECYSCCVKEKTWGASANRMCIQVRR